MTNPDLTHLALIVDRSGSMRPIAQDMNGAIITLLEEQDKLPGELHVDVSTFDNTVEHIYTVARATDVKGELVVPRGMTALNDAIGQTVTRLGERLAALPEAERPGKVILAIVTDGGENASQEWLDAKDVKALVEKQRDEFNWELLFFGASSMDAFAAAESYGIGRGQTISFDHSAAGAGGMSFAASTYMASTRAGLKTEFTDEERKAAAGE